MDIQARVCVNCGKYDSSGNCAKDSVWTPITDPKAHWCFDGVWFRWDEANANHPGMYQAVTRVDSVLDMGLPKEVTPMHRDYDTSMVVVPDGQELTFDGQLVDISTQEEVSL